MQQWEYHSTGNAKTVETLVCIVSWVVLPAA